MIRQCKVFRRPDCQGGGEILNSSGFESELKAADTGSTTDRLLVNSYQPNLYLNTTDNYGEFIPTIRILPAASRIIKSGSHLALGVTLLHDSDPTIPAKELLAVTVKV
jgi:hypothetical protein